MATPNIELSTVDPTPGPNDITSFEQAREQSVPSPAAPNEPSTPPAVPSRPPKEIKLGAPADPNRSNVIPQEISDDLDRLAGREVKTDKTEPEAKTEPKTETPDASDPADDADIEKQVQAFKTLKEVRTAHKEALKRERAWKLQEAEWKSRLEQTEGRIKELPSPDTIKATMTELEAARKRAEDLDAKVKLLDYTQSSEFHAKHLQPLAKELEKAYSEVRELSVHEADGTVRAGTDTDFKRLLSMDSQKAGEEAEAKFGKFAAMEVMARRRAVIDLERSKREALSGAEKASQEAQQRQQVEQGQQAEKLSSAYKNRVAEVESKWPKLFKEREGDKEGNEWLEKGRALPNALDSQDVSIEERVKIAAEVRLRAASWPRLLWDLTKAEKERDNALARLKEFEKSAPRDGDGGQGQAAGQDSADPMDRAMKGIDALARRG